MKGESHLDEAMLNMYLDGELADDAKEHVEAHWAACEECRAELAALGQLFAALEELAPVPDLVPAVLARIEPRHQHLGLTCLSERVTRRRLLSPLLQMVAALGLLAFVWVWLAGHGPTGGVAPSLENAWDKASSWLSGLWTAEFWSTPRWFTDLWDTFSTWSGTVRTGLRGWGARLSAVDLRLSTVQLLILGAILGSFWLAGNALLIRRALLSGRMVRVKRRI